MKWLTILLIAISVNAFGQSLKEGEYNSMSEALQNPLRVKKLDLSEQNIKTLPSEVLQLENLTELNISSNQDLDLIQAISVLHRLNNLKILWITKAKISKLPDQIAGLESIEELWLDDNEFSEIPEAIKRLPKLKYVSFFSNKIGVLSLRKGDFLGLTQINLCYNEFKIFPVQLAVLPRLKRISIWGNGMTVIPVSVSKLKKVEQLDLEINSLTTIPVEMAKLKHLKNLSLWSNKLDAQGVSPVYRIKGLQKLELRENNISFIYNEIGGLRKLTNLDISSNPLDNIPVDIKKLKCLAQLGIGNLPNFKWTTVFYSLQHLPKLRKVGMYSMRITKMPNGFDKLNQVKLFWMNDNSFNQNEKDRIKALLPQSEIKFD